MILQFGDQTQHHPWERVLVTVVAARYMVSPLGFPLNITRKVPLSGLRSQTCAASFPSIFHLLPYGKTEGMLKSKHKGKILKARRKTKQIDGRFSSENSNPEDNRMKAQRL